MLIQDCPYSIDVSNPPVAGEVVVVGDGLSGGFVGERGSVTVDARNAGRGELTVDVSGNSGEVDVAEEEEGMFTVTYTAPEVAGTYLLNVKWSDEDVPGSPFSLDIRERIEAHKIVVTGSGITEGTVGLPTLFTVDARNAGPGHLTCTCRAPSGEHTDVAVIRNTDGTHTVDLNVMEPGVHKVHVKWGEEAVPQSPFLVKISKKPDASMVTCYGPGLRSGLLDTFEGRFQVDTGAGGPGALKVRVDGPKGSFKVEMSRDKLQSRMITVKYNPTVPGLYTANVLWSDQHVAGSPFQVFVAAKKSHMEKWSILKQENEHNGMIKT